MNNPIQGINSGNDDRAVAVTPPRNAVGVPCEHGAHDNTIHSRVNERCNVCVLPDAAANFDGNADLSANFGNNRTVVAASARGIQIHDMYPAGSDLDESLGHRDRIFPVHRNGRIVTSGQAYALTI
jgi:hypothetical protein